MNHNKTTHKLQVSSNPLLKIEFIEYLEQHGWKFNPITFGGTKVECFDSPSSKYELYVKGECIDVSYWDAVKGQGGNTFLLHKSFTGLENLTLHGFMMLMHVLDIVPLTDFLAVDARKANARPIADIVVSDGNEVHVTAIAEQYYETSNN